MTITELNFQGVSRAKVWNEAAQGAARFPLSTSPSGTPVNIASGSVGNGTLVHTFSAEINAIEEVYLYASNYTSGTTYITMSFATSSAGAFVSSNQIVAPISGNLGPILCYPGIPHRSTGDGNDSPLNMYVTTNANNKINVFGYVIRYYAKSDNRDDTEFGYVVE